MYDCFIALLLNGFMVLWLKEAKAEAEECQAFHVHCFVFCSVFRVPGSQVPGLKFKVQDLTYESFSNSVIQ